MTAADAIRPASMPMASATNLARGHGLDGGMGGGSLGTQES